MTPKVEIYYADGTSSVHRMRGTRDPRTILDYVAWQTAGFSVAEVYVTDDCGNEWRWCLDNGI